MKGYEPSEEYTHNAKEPEMPYSTVQSHSQERYYTPCEPRKISEEEIARCMTLEEFKRHMDDIVESTHNLETNCVEYTPVVPRPHSIRDVERQSMSLEQFTGRLKSMVDDYYNTQV